MPQCCVRFAGLVSALPCACRRVPLGGVSENMGLPWRVVVTDPSKEGCEQGEGERGVQLLLQRVGARMGSQHDTGFALWPAAMILARYLLAHT